MAIKKIYANYMTLFIDKTSDNKVNLKIFLLRAVSVIGIGFFWISLNDFIESPPAFDDADKSRGVLSEVSHTGGRLGGVRNIVIDTGSGYKTFKTYAISETKPLKDRIGSSIKIWSYPSRDMFFVERQNVIEIEIDGAKILNNWPRIREKIEDRKSISSILLGGALMLLPLFFVYKLVIKNR